MPLCEVLIYSFLFKLSLNLARALVFCVKNDDGGSQLGLYARLSDLLAEKFNSIRQAFGHGFFRFSPLRAEQANVRLNRKDPRQLTANNTPKPTRKTSLMQPPQLFAAQSLPTPTTPRANPAANLKLRLVSARAVGPYENTL